MDVHDVSLYASVLGKPLIVHNYNGGYQNVERTTQVIKVASRFIFDFLVCIPLELCSFAANIFFLGLINSREDASQVLL